MWKSEDITETDRIIDDIEYIGESLSCNTMIVGITITSSVLLSSITSKVKPLGNLVINQYTILNPVEYANGIEEPKKTLLKSSRINVSKIGDSLLINFSEIPISSSKCAKKLIEIAKPHQIIVLTSKHFSYIIDKDCQPNNIYTISSDGNSNFPAPNTINGVPAALLIQSQINHIDCKVHIVIDEDSGTSIQSLNVLYEQIKQYVGSNDEVVNKAFDIYQLRINDLGMIYT